MKYFIWIVVCSLLFISTTVTATPTKISWDDLIPETAKTEDPLANLSEEEAGLIEWIIYLREYLPEKVQPANQDLYDEMIVAMPKLKEKGYDVDAIIAERRKNNLMVNTALDGKMVLLSGYLLPLDMSQSEVREFLLVPYVGACIHTPPPPPNQIVYAKLDKPITFSLEDIYRPVTLLGRLHIQRSSKELYMVDGADNLDIGFSMEVSSIEIYKE